jgi:hypothetical protein
MEYHDAQLLNIPENSSATEVITQSVNYLRDRVDWRQFYIGTYFSVIILFIVLWLLYTYNGLRYNPMEVPWIIIVLVVFFIFYSIGSFLSYHRTKHAFINIEEALRKI